MANSISLEEILGYVGFYYERNEETGNFFVYDYEDDTFEEECETLSDVLGVVSGHLEMVADNTVENISEECGESVLSTGGWKWEDYADYIKGRMANFKENKALTNLAQNVLDIVTALADPKSIEL